MLKLPRLQQNLAIVNDQGQPTVFFQTLFNDAMQKIEEGQDGLQIALAAIEAQNAAIAAQNVAIDAQNDTILAQQDQIIRSLRAISHADGLFLTSEPDGATAKISITAHTRNYLDEVVSVDAGVITGLLYATVYNVYYDDAARAGGTVTYVATETPADAVTSTANPDRQFVGAVTTPATSGSPPTDGTGTTPPGYPGSGYDYETP